VFACEVADPAEQDDECYHADGDCDGHCEGCFFRGSAIGGGLWSTVSVMNKERNKTPRKDNAGKEGDKGEYLVK